MSTDDKNLARMRVAVRSGHLPTDLGEWALAQLEDSTGRKIARNQALTDAAAQIDGSTHSRAACLAVEMIAIREDPRYWSMYDRGTDIRSCLVRALVFNDHRPVSERQIRRIVGQMDR